MRATTAVHSRRQLSASGRPARHSRKRTAVCDGQHADEPGRCSPRGADSIPIVRHRLRGRFSPTGSFAYRTRGGAVSIAINCAPRPPGKRLSALCKAFHSDPFRSFGDMASGRSRPQPRRSVPCPAPLRCGHDHVAAGLGGLHACRRLLAEVLAFGTKAARRPGVHVRLQSEDTNLCPGQFSGPDGRTQSRLLPVARRWATAAECARV
jgi:hypothetical protein